MYIFGSVFGGLADAVDVLRDPKGESEAVVPKEPDELDDLFASENTELPELESVLPSAALNGDALF